MVPNQLSYIDKIYSSAVSPAVFERLQKAKLPGIPGIQSIIKYPDELHIREERIPGQTLEELLRLHLFSESDALNIIQQLCVTVSKLHKIGIIHSDIKPENIIITPAGKVYLIDYDAARICKKNRRNRIDHTMGTPGYAAPEQYGYATADERTDIYAIGMLLNIMLTGQFPNVCLSEGAVRPIILNCISMDPDDRYGQVRQLLYEVRFLLQHHRKYYRFLPPGFRSLRPFRMILSVLGYALSILIPLLSTTSLPTDSITPYQLSCFRGLLIAYFLGHIFIGANYLHVNFLLPFAKKNIGLRILSIVLEYLIWDFILFGVLLLLVIINPSTNT